jgi:hypothetical protein
VFPKQLFKIKIKQYIMKKIITIKSVVLSIAFFTISTTIFAQEESASPASEAAPATKFGGSADAYYKYDFAGVDGNGLTSFTKAHDSFELGMASIEASHTMGKASAFVDLGFGKRAQEFSYNENNGVGNAESFMIKQLYLTYQFTDAFKVTFGSFGTHFGYELVDAVDNKNYSMSYAFTNGPFFNTGVKAQYTKGKLTFMLGLSNPTDFKSAIQAKSKQKTVIGQIGYVADSGSAYLNFTTGSNNSASTTNVSQIDFTGSKKINDKFSLGLNATYAILQDDLDSKLDANWFSVIGYASYAINAKSTLAYRLEFLGDKDGAALFGEISTPVIDNNVISNTLSFNYKEGNFTFIPELRLDAAAKDVFVKNNGTATGTAASILLGTTYSF